YFDSPSPGGREIKGGGIHPHLSSLVRKKKSLHERNSRKGCHTTISRSGLVPDPTKCNRSGGVHPRLILTMA
ncbi:MAG: hypothetical protein KAV98_00590, partial [Dehalococcoidia bacterium]|nr:hypothetical protein [Dehalococcoidia bacterium]